MATWYFKNSVDNNWETLGNWWSSSDATGTNPTVVPWNGNGSNYYSNPTSSDNLSVCDGYTGGVVINQSIGSYEWSPSSICDISNITANFAINGGNWTGNDFIANFYISGGTFSGNILTANFDINQSGSVQIFIFNNTFINNAYILSRIYLGANTNLINNGNIAPNLIVYQLLYNGNPINAGYNGTHYTNGFADSYTGLDYDYSLDPTGTIFYCFVNGIGNALDALGYCNGDATTDRCGNTYSPSNEDGNTLYDDIGFSCASQGSDCSGHCCNYGSGCSNGAACNYNGNTGGFGSCDDGSCYGYYGCADSSACNYDSGASCDDGSCQYSDNCGNCSGNCYSTCCNNTCGDYYDYDYFENYCCHGAIGTDGFGRALCDGSYGTCSDSTACGEDIYGCIYARDALGVCYGDAILDCADNAYSPINELELDLTLVDGLFGQMYYNGGDNSASFSDGPNAENPQFFNLHPEYKTLIYTTTEIRNFYVNDEYEIQNLNPADFAQFGGYNALPQYSWQFVGRFRAPYTDDFSFSTWSDDASYLWLGANALTGYDLNNALVSNGGSHGNQQQSSFPISLNSGEYYPIRIQ